MCDWGTTTPLNLFVPAHLSRTGEGRWDIAGVDSCIAPLVKALNEAGFTTVASCCGHGKRPGNIVLADGRELAIMPDYSTSRKADRLYGALGFQPINPWPLEYRMRSWPRRLAMRALAALIAIA